ncbi:6-O-methylguanine DNA methyltransferase [Erwinia amylovora LA635]|nr:6-O-methylguanine DNA methyltransferase [Erwinia amylovora LA635]CDK17930.1 hypothetical protein LA636_0938 [Erwinia amylovora LA636]CDK21299.1 6-O-methylguanine DNA methyltransferase [Erwinia amylovora LA637]
MMPLPIASYLLITVVFLLNLQFYSPPWSIMSLKSDNFQQRIWQIIAAIPHGSVVTYGDVALLAGSPRAARQVGGVLKRLPEGSKLPWHRVINRKGEISLAGDVFVRQRLALLSENIEVSLEGKICLQRYRWQRL